jgi:hypothetical protein
MVSFLLDNFLDVVVLAWGNKSPHLVVIEDGVDLSTDGKLDG